MNLFKQKQNASSISHVLINKHKTKFSEPVISIRQLEEKDIDEVRQLLYDHFNSLTLPAVIYWSIQHIYDLLVIIIINYIFFLDLKKIFYFLIIFLIYLYIRAKFEFLNHIRKDCPDLENLYKSYIGVEGCNFWVAEVFDNNFGSASRTTCSDIHEREKIILEQEEQEKLLSNEKNNIEIKNSYEDNENGKDDSFDKKNTSEYITGFCGLNDTPNNSNNSNNKNVKKENNSNSCEMDNKVNSQNENINSKDDNKKLKDMVTSSHCEKTITNVYSDIYYNNTNSSSSIQNCIKNGAKNGENGKNDENSERVQNNSTTTKNDNENTNNNINNIKDNLNSNEKNNEKSKSISESTDITSNRKNFDNKKTVPLRLNDLRRNIFDSKLNDDEDINYKFMNRKIIGCVGIIPYKGDNSIAQLVRMVVKKDNRRMRIGSRLLTQLENFAHEHNYQELKVFTNNLNTDSLYFVKQNGFDLSQIVRRGLMRGDLLIWSKILNKDDFYKFHGLDIKSYTNNILD
ncbi:N-acetyltransferase, GNAT family, putative [Plasmodium yoelii]|uniref:N-acetyltransferase n=2 Tax=Plasmodium yoelii TaxID=5861 RepID=A0AAE9WL17_PLAYO|nr:N-acetyltransferase, GNAT family, putative [Plasmodium yoelii]WBY56013.1 N-acetyltransferase [Plasmodium yoelii yoelii]CDU16996.1 N-acetyltransferase, putative [Plasmodium yoelii]VTZ75366.1 N-acetyltransferase, GNAT family, putative [Plasmodium yoelii]|eukprot:XP_022813169.1 N-acetyltransferase, GNAT family, putative [Plasmodium yoelii]